MDGAAPQREPRVVEVNGRALTVFDTTSAEPGEPMVRDLDLAAWLEFGRPRDIRPLIKRYAEAKEIWPLEKRGTAPRFTHTGQSRGSVETIEFWLNEPDALFIAAKSETPKANELLRHVIATFIAARRELEKTVPVRAHHRRPPRPEVSTLPAPDSDEGAPLLVRLGSYSRATLDELCVETGRTPEEQADVILTGHLCLERSRLPMSFGRRVFEREGRSSAKGSSKGRRS